MARFSIPNNVFVGCNSLSEAKSCIKSYGSKTLIVTGKHVVKSPMFRELTETLLDIETEYIVFDGITGEPTDVMISQGVELFTKNNCQFVIGIGGGSPLDSAKAIAAMAVNEGSISDYVGREIAGDIPKIVAIPTTSGTGSEATKFTVITDTKKDIKMLLKGEKLVPDTAIVNPNFSLDMPKSVTAATGLDALTHAVEAYTSVKAMELTDPYAISAVKRIVKYLPMAYQNGYDKKARTEMAIAAFEAGICINNSSVTLVHGMSRPIGALFHVPHGISNAMLLSECIGFALDGAYERFATLGRAVGAATENDDDKTAAEKFLAKLKEVCDLCEVPTLAEYGVDMDRFKVLIDKMSEDAVASGSPGNTRKEVTVEDCKRLYMNMC
ncbi:MAG: iron-containing alcohol dehydrogenase [Butyrivibrio sp.]|nr:iron-containing alcohol dehydrogenase [Butyrivibrio sp.]